MRMRTGRVNRRGPWEHLDREVVHLLVHEGRNALDEIQSGLNLIRLDLACRTETLETLDAMTPPRCDLARIFADLEDFSAASKVILEPCRLAEAWRTAFERLSVQAGRRMELRETGEVDITVSGDLKVLAMAFARLFEESLRACCDPVTIEVESSSAAVRGKRVARIAVRDNRTACRTTGDRAPPLAAAQAKNASALAIAIARRVVSAHGGALVLRPEDHSSPVLILLPS